MLFISDNCRLHVGQVMGLSVINSLGAYQITTLICKRSMRAREIVHGRISGRQWVTAARQTLYANTWCLPSWRVYVRNFRGCLRENNITSDGWPVCETVTKRENCHGKPTRMMHVDSEVSSSVLLGLVLCETLALLLKSTLRCFVTVVSSDSSTIMSFL